MLTCKSLVVSECGGERLIEPVSCWFLPKVPSGSLWQKGEFGGVKRMIGALGGSQPLDYYQTLNLPETASTWQEVCVLMNLLSQVGHSLVSSAGAVG